MCNLYKFFRTDAILILMKKFKYTSVMQVPTIKKIVLNMGIGEAVFNKKIIVYAIKNLTDITGQKPLVIKAKRSIAQFKIRQGLPIGCKVTLRNKKMWDFLYKLISISIPRIRDFRGFSIKSFDGRGNYNMGIHEQIIFPEIDYDKIDEIRGLDINIITTAKQDNEGRFLLELFNFPFKK
ncbi:50S ribosomal protein L5 [Candidatus Purcelliella pentastirinorum]|uniref:Large ribosomal subunit protein uL5 n=1 Tax=Candidatus Purcelliella pentastirinorum TaxID=472834 RepID=A0AAX3N7N8_9ENTR|nr:50S ribosomal protein L5 [Candidatus Purcelliella pentastirinorum]WDI78572.1 50S ribosomal protein L5 [Candidatus Purcelliella pentastirinorum]WDR80400.1 50S ribosomal protein L5 [Candidatus Purcelliella pentastirinorum]